MTETPALPSPETRDEPVAALPPPEPTTRRSFAPWLIAAGFLILAAGIVWVWQNPNRQPDPQAVALAQQVRTLEARVAGIEQKPAQTVPDLRPLIARVTALEQRPAQGADLAPLAERVTVLEQRTAQGTQAGAPTDLARLAARVAALEKRPPPDLAPLEARIAAIEARQQVEAQQAARVDALAARIDALDTGQRTAQAEVNRRVDADGARLAAIERSTGQIATLVDRANRLARIQAAQLALDRGQALGEIPGAPPALARFATTKPPTEASLRLAFPAAAQVAVAVAKPSVEGKPILMRLWAEAQDLVTIREGDRVLVGDPAAGVLAQARAVLDAGDLTGAVAEVTSLTGPAAEAMAGWLTQARALLEARAALADWAAHA